MKKRASSIGIFDSGFGGITILRSIVKELPQYSYIYLGDTARTPYGTRSQEIIYEFTVQAVDFLFKKGCNLIILACNSASSEALRKIQQEYLPQRYPGKKVLGVVIPAVEAGVKKTKNGKVGILATEGTVYSQAFVKEITKLSLNIKTFQKAAPLLVSVVEAGEQNLPATKIILKQYLQPLIKKKIDILILGCTHYSILEQQIKRIVGKNTAVISEGKIVAQKLKKYLNRHPEIETCLLKNSKVIFFSTDLTDKFVKLGSKFFGRKIKVEKITLL